MHSGPSPLPSSWSSPPGRPVLGLWIALALTLLLLVVVAQSVTAVSKKYTLQRNKNVLFDNEKVLPEGTEFTIVMDVKPGYKVDVLLMTREDYDSYTAGGLWTFTADGSFLDVDSYHGTFKVPEKAHWVWVVDNTNQPEGGAYANADLWIDASVDIEKTNIWALFALLFFICLLILICLSFIYNRWHLPKEARHDRAVTRAQQSNPPVMIPRPRYHRDIELPGYASTHYQEYESETYAGTRATAEPHERPAGAPEDHQRDMPVDEAAPQPDTVRPETHAVRVAQATTVPGNVNPRYYDKPAYIKRREARGEGLGGVGSEAPEEARTVSEPDAIPGPDGEPSEFSHCTTCFAIVPSTSTFCYRCKASLT